jgi:hypothetical protein
VTGRPADAVEAWAPGDPVRQQVLRESLVAIAENHDDPEVRRLVGRCLGGGLTVRELVREPRFEDAMGVAMTQLATAVEQMEPEEKAAWRARGRALAEDQAGPVSPGR